MAPRSKLLALTLTDKLNRVSGTSFDRRDHGASFIPPKVARRNTTKFSRGQRIRIMASDDPNIDPQYDGCRFTCGALMPTFQYTIEANEEPLQEWPLYQAPFATMPPSRPLPSAQYRPVFSTDGQSPYLGTSQHSSSAPPHLPTQSYAEEEWESMKPVIVDLYINEKRPLQSVRNIMEKKHAFKAR
jgi:hypothetical protein